MSIEIALPNQAYMLPTEVPLWPPAWPFWVAVSAMLLAIITGIIYLLIRHKHRAYRREALLLLNEKMSCPQSDAEKIAACLEIIRRCLLSSGRGDLCGLSTEPLLQTLDGELPKKYQFGRQGIKTATSIYQAPTSESASDCQTFVRVTNQWIRRHRG